jgi:hypothetical protein
MWPEESYGREEEKWVEIIRGESPNCHAHKCSIVCVFVGLGKHGGLNG